MIGKIRTLLLPVVVLAGCASTPPVPPLNLAVAPVPVAAEYVTKRKESYGDGHAHAAQGNTTVQWQFFRDDNAIVIHNVSAHTGETWERDGKAIIMRQLFHDDRKGVEYRLDDFAVLGMTPSWDRQALLVDPALLKKMEPAGDGWQDGHPVRRYKGAVDGQTLDVVWLVDLNLPYRLSRHQGEDSEESTLLAVYPLSQSPWPRAEGEGYGIIDYTDLGDMERDPFVMKIQSQLPGGEVHHH